MVVAHGNLERSSRRIESREHQDSQSPIARDPCCRRDALQVTTECSPNVQGGPMLPRPAAPDPAPLPLPLLGRLVPAGFPSPADDYLDGEIDLNRFLIERPAACYLMRVAGPSMSGAGILDGDLVVVDRSLAPAPGHVVVAVIDGEMTIKRLRRLKSGTFMLVAEHPGYPSTTIGEEHPAGGWGGVAGCGGKRG